MKKLVCHCTVKDVRVMLFIYNKEQSYSIIQPDSSEQFRQPMYL